MMLIVTVFISLILSLIFSLRFKNYLILLLIITITSVILLEILITKDIAAFYYRYYYHWLFLLPILLSLPLLLITKRKKKSIFLVAIFIIWGYFFIRFPIMNVLQNIKYLNTDSTWFDSFSREYAVRKANINDYIDWQYPKTKGIIKWCEHQENIIDIYTFDPRLRFYDDEKGLKAFFIKCNYKNYNLEKSKTPKGLFDKFINEHQDAYYLSLEPCNPAGFRNPFTDQADAQAYEVNQMLVCSSKQIIPYLFKIRRK